MGNNAVNTREVTRQIEETLKAHDLPLDTLPWVASAFGDPLDARVTEDLQAWCGRKERLRNPRYFCFYSPEWFGDHLDAAEDTLREASQSRTDYQQLESQALTLAIQYLLEVVQRPHAFAQVRLQTLQALATIDASAKKSEAAMGDVDAHERILQAHHAMRQDLHRIGGGALNFRERLDEIVARYVLQFKELADRCEAAHHGLRSGMGLELAAPPGAAAFDGKGNPVAAYRTWISEARRKLNACVFSETQCTFAFSLKELVPGFQEKVKNLGKDALLALDFEVPFPKLGAEEPAGIFGIHPVAVSPLPTVPNKGIVKESAWEFPLRTDEKSIERGRLLRSAFDVTIEPPVQDSGTEGEQWQPATRRFENVPFAGDRTLPQSVDRTASRGMPRLHARGRFALSLSGAARMGTAEETASALTTSEFSDAKLEDLAIVVDAVYRSALIPGDVE